MRRTRRISLASLLVLTALVGGPGAAQSLRHVATGGTNQHGTAPSPDIAAVDDATVRYYVVLAGYDPDFASLGGTVEAAWKDRRVVTLPAAAVDGLAANAAVAYMRLVAQPQDGASFEGPSPFIDEQMKAVVAAPEGSGQWTTGSYAYDGGGNIKWIGPDSYGRTQNYTYDGVSRITYGTAHTKSGLLTEQYDYDPYGNMTWSSTGPSMATDPATNRLMNVKYDEAGHITQYGAANYEWDGGGMMKERWGDGPRTRYVYTPDDERIGTLRVDAGWWTWTVRDFGGKVVREYESPSSGESWLWVEDYAHGAGRLLASEREPSEGGRRHYHLDHLGTTRMVTSGETATLGTRLSEHVYYPFGTESPLLVQEPNGRQTRLKYTGHERDYVGGETGENTNVLDYMHARYYSPNFGRFLSTDPGKDWDVGKPQSWNLYSYTRNNPINFSDPTGRYLGASNEELAAAHDAMTPEQREQFAKAQETGFKIAGGLAVALLPGPEDILLTGWLAKQGVKHGARLLGKLLGKGDEVVDTVRTVAKTEDVTKGLATPEKYSRFRLSCGLYRQRQDKA